MQRSITFNIDSEVYKKFKISLLISGEDESGVVQELLQNYTKETYVKAADEMRGGAEAETEKNVTEYKVVRKIERWSKSTGQINHQIVKAFLKTRDPETGIALKSKMRECFSEMNSYSYASFSTGFNSMLTESGNSHGKVFVCAGDEVELFEPIKGVVEQYAHYFLG